MLFFFIIATMAIQPNSLMRVMLVSQQQLLTQFLREKLFCLLFYLKAVFAALAKFTVVCKL